VPSAWRSSPRSSAKPWPSHGRQRPDAVDALVAATLERHGRIDGLVNNADVSLHEPLDALDLDEFEQVLQLNVISVVGVTRRSCRRESIAVSLVLPSSTAMEFGGRYRPGVEVRPGMVAHSPDYVADVILRALRTGEARIHIPPGPGFLDGRSAE
jgi:short-subunit dehydrogenase